MKKKLVSMRRKRPTFRKKSRILNRIASDIVPKDYELWKLIVQSGMSVSEMHDFLHIDTPVLESVGVFEEGGGITPFGGNFDGLQLGSFEHGRLIARPDATVSVMRSYLENHLSYLGVPLKLFHHSPIFRIQNKESPQVIQVRQWGFDIIGESDPVYDIDVLLTLMAFMKSVKISNVTLRVNVVGCKVCSPAYKSKLREYYKTRKGKVCSLCVERLDRAPLQMLACEDARCREEMERAPILFDSLCQNCNNYFKVLLELLEDNDIEYFPDPYFVREFDYFSRGIFEFQQSDRRVVLAHAGRYDYLAEILGGRVTPSVGGRIYLDALLAFLREKKNVDSLSRRSRVFFAAVGDQAKKSSLRLMSILRTHGIPVIEALGKRSLSAQMRYASRQNVPVSIILGQKEVFEGTVLVKDMKTGAQESLLLDNLIEGVKKSLKSSTLYN